MDESKICDCFARDFIYPFEFEFRESLFTFYRILFLVLETALKRT